MMKFKKFLAAAMTGAMMFGMVATACPTISLYAAESNTNRSDLTVDIDYSRLVATIESKSGDKYVLLEVLKIKNDQPDGDKVSATYSYPLDAEGKVEVDLSFLNLSKVCAIQARGDADNMAKASEYKLIAKQAKKPSFKYTPNEKADKSGLSVGKSFTTKEGEIGEENVKGYEYKSLYGTQWENLTGFDLDTAAMAGTTLMIRTAAVTTGENLAPVGAEVKVKIAAAPKAPKVKVDYGKGTIALPKGTMVKILYSADNGTASQAEEGNEAKYTFEVVGEYYAKLGTGTLEKVTDENASTYFDLNAETGEIAAKADAKFFDTADQDNNLTATVKGDYDSYIIAKPVQSTTPSGNTVHVESDEKPVGDKAISKTPAEVLAFCGIGDAAQQEKILKAGFVVAVYTPAAYDKKKTASNMTLISVDGIETPDDKEPGKVTTTSGSLSWTDDGTNVSFTADGADFEYTISENEPTSATKWTAVKQGRPSKKKSTDIVGKNIYIRQAGDKTKNVEKLPSNPVAVKIVAGGNDNPSTSTPVEIIEEKTGLIAWEVDVIYYSDAEGNTEIDKTIVTAPTEGEKYYVKAVYTPVPNTVTAPVSGTTYYTTTDKKIFTAATLEGDKFAEGTFYYTREEAKKATTPEA